MASGDLPNNGPPRNWYQPPEHPPREDSESVRWPRLVLALLFAAALFALGHVMIAHHFFAGGAQDNQMSRPNGP